jgi:hypothetical protein
LGIDLISTQLFNRMIRRNPSIRFRAFCAMGAAQILALGLIVLMAGILIIGLAGGSVTWSVLVPLSAGTVMAGSLWFSNRSRVGTLFSPTFFVSFTFFLPHLVIGGLLLSTGLVRPYYLFALGVSPASIWKSLVLQSIAWIGFAIGGWFAKRRLFSGPKVGRKGLSDSGSREATRAPGGKGLLLAGVLFGLVGIVGMGRAVASGSTAGQQSGEGTVEVFVSALFPFGIFVVLWWREALASRIARSAIAFGVAVAVVKGVLVFAAVVLLRSQDVPKIRLIRIFGLGLAALFVGLTIGTSVRVEQRLLRTTATLSAETAKASVPPTPTTPTTISAAIQQPAVLNGTRSGEIPRNPIQEKPLLRERAPFQVRETPSSTLLSESPIVDSRGDSSETFAEPASRSNEPLRWPFSPGPGSANLEALGWLVPKSDPIAPETLSIRREASTRALSGVVNRGFVTAIGDATRLIGQRLDAVASLAVVIELAEEKHEVEPASVRADLSRSVLVGLVPRWFWASKPTVNDPRALSSVYFGVSNNSFAVTSVNDLWRQFGWLGVSVGFFLLGLLSWMLYLRCTNLRQKPLGGNERYRLNSRSGLAEGFYFVVLLRGINLEADFATNIPTLLRIGIVVGCAVGFAWSLDRLWEAKFFLFGSPSRKRESG